MHHSQLLGAGTDGHGTVPPAAVPAMLSTDGSSLMIWSDRNACSKLEAPALVFGDIAFFHEDA